MFNLESTTDLCQSGCLIIRLRQSLLRLFATMKEASHDISLHFLGRGRLHSCSCEVYVNRICKEAHPESQVHINVYIKRNEK